MARSSPGRMPAKIASRSMTCSRYSTAPRASSTSELLISPRKFCPVGENGMTPNCSGRSGKGICKTGCFGVREEDAAASTADFSCRGDGDQQSDRSTKRGGEGVLYPRPPTGVPARGARRAELPDVHQPDDREWDGKTQRDREDVWRADGHGEAIYEVVPGQRGQRVLRGETAA